MILCFSCGWEKIARHIDQMLEDRDTYGFAADFLESVRKQARDRSHITPRQANGVRNVWKGANKQKRREEEPEDEKFNRRYEGHDPSRH